MNGNSFSAAGRCRLITLLMTTLWYIATNIAMAGIVVDFDDIDFWTGTGSNRSALVIDWQGASTIDNSLAWGYRWDGIAKGADMLTTVVTADDRLYAKMGTISGFGFAVIGLGYDANNDGQFALDDETSFDASGIANTGPSDGATSVDPGDWYAEGWFSADFWHYGLSPTSPFAGGTWARSGSGVSSRNLTDGSWDSLAFTPIGQQFFAQNPLAAEVPGNADFNGDGDIDGRDFLAWQRGESPDPLSPGDLGFWSEQYGTDPNDLSAFTGGALQSASLVVPEPTSLDCLCLAAGAWSVFFFCFRQNNKKLSQPGD
ncbi:MAG: hypothetical protein SH868_02275 [Bythopirellula sp.]|nr:hypothetical protein [Bythopirellula sp.]